MEITKRIIITLILVILTAGTTIQAEPEISETYIASCLLKVTSDPSILPLDDMTIDYLLHSSGIAGKAAREILGVQTEEDLEEAIETEWLADESDIILHEESFPGENMAVVREDYEGMEHPAQMGRLKPARSMGRRISGEPSSVASEQTILLRLAVDISVMGDCRQAAREFMNAIVNNLDVTLKNAYDEHIQRLRNRLKLAEEEASRTESELRQMQEILRETAGSRILDKERILDDVMDKRYDLQEIRMNIESDEVIIEEITKRIAETQAKLKDQIAEDEVTGEMQQLLKTQIQHVEEAKVQLKHGVGSSNNLAEAERQLAQAKIELARRREELSRASGGNLIESLNRELANRSMQAAQNQVKIAGLTRQIAEAEELLNKTDDYELLTLKAEIARDNLRESIVWRDRISRKIRLIQPPAVSALGGD